MSERVCPNCGAPLEGVSIYDDVICDYCGSEIKGEKRVEETQTQTVELKPKYKINWVDTYVTDSNYENRLRRIAIPKGEKRALKFKVYFDAVREDAVENARLGFYSYKTKKFVSDERIKTELKKGDTTMIYQKPLTSFEEGEYLIGLSLKGNEPNVKDIFCFRIIIGNEAPIIKETLNTAENREICAQTALNMCRTRKLSECGMIPVRSNIMSISYGAKYKSLFGIPEGVETYMIFETSLRKAKKGLAICNNGLYLNSDYGRTYMSWYEFLFAAISSENGLKVGKHTLINWSGETELMADLLSDIQRRIIDDIKI